MAKITYTAEKPSAHICINNGRCKSYSTYQGEDTNKDCTGITKFYSLENHQEFQIELYNPTERVKGVKLKINGELSNGTLILRPGERFFLDRYIDNQNKFMYDEYFVLLRGTINTPIRFNGDIEVLFFDEAKKDINEFFNTKIWGKNPYIYETPTIYDWGRTPVIYYSGPNSTSNFLNCDIDGSNIQNASITTSTFSNGLNENEIKTGRISKGEKSYQEFGVGYEQFENIASSVVKMNISTNRKQTDCSSSCASTTDLFSSRRYCTNCGKHLKQSFKYCPKCGQKA